MRLEGVIYRIKRSGRLTLEASFGLLKRYFYDNIPSDDIKDLPATFAFTLGSLAYISILTVFTLLFVYGYLDDISQKFLSASSDSGRCDLVPRTVTGTYMADTEGRWESNPKFEYTKAIYSFTFPGFRGSHEVYKESLDMAFDYLAAVGRKAYSQNLAINVLYWMTLSGAVVAGESSNTFQMNGSPKVLFSKLIYYASFSDESGVCPVHPHISYDSGSATLRFEFSYDAFTSSASCTAIVKPEHMGFSSKYSLDYFSFSVDAQTLLTAVAINTGILSIVDLELVPQSSFEYLYRDIPVRLGKYFYPRYPGMMPLFCLGLSEFQLVCTIQYYDLYLYPIFNHAGYNTLQPRYCSCADLSVGQSDECNFFNFIAGFAFFDYNEENGESEDDAIKKLLDGVLAGNLSAQQINRAAFNASFDAAVNDDHDYASSSSWRHDAYSFCRLADGTGCSMFSVFLSEGHTTSINRSSEAVNVPNKVYTVSDNYYQLTQGSCNDSFNVSPESRALLADHTPQPLSESYYECTPSKTNAAINAWGIASSNVTMLTPMLVAVVLMAFVGYNNCKKREVAHTYSSGELSDVLHYVAFSLLKARDGHYEGSPEDVLCQLRVQLGVRESTNRFYIANKTDTNASSDVLVETDGRSCDDIELRTAGGNGDQPKMRKTSTILASSDFDKMPNPMYVKSSDTF